jgi:hypothetical protein
MKKQHIGKNLRMEGRSKSISDLITYLAEKPAKGGAVGRIDIAVTDRGGQRMEVGSAEIRKLISKVQRWIGEEMNQPRMLNLTQKWNHLRNHLEVKGDGNIDNGAAKWRVELNERAKALLGEARIDQEKKWIIDEIGNTASIPDFVCKAHNLGLFGLKETAANLFESNDYHGILVEAVEKLQVHDEAISEPKDVSKTLITFCKKWYGEGREGRWNSDSAGNAHPLAKMDRRGDELMTALINGNYESIAREEEGEKLPAAVKALYDKGLFNKQKVGKGEEAGRDTTEEDFELLLQPITESEWNDSRRQAKKCSTWSVNLYHPQFSCSPSLELCSHEPTPSSRIFDYFIHSGVPPFARSLRASSDGSSR